MMMMTAHGRLAAEPELRMLGNGSAVCEFRLLATRFAKNAEHVEAVTFFCYGDMAEDFCSTTVKGQLIYACGTQETQHYRPEAGVAKTYVKYRMNWFQRGAKPAGDRGNDGQSRGQYGGGQREHGGSPPRPQYPDQQSRRQNQVPPADPQQRPPQVRPEYAGPDDGFLDSGFDQQRHY